MDKLKDRMLNVLRERLQVVKLQAIQTMPVTPPRLELIPIGEYDGVDLPGTVIDENYIVWQEIENPEFECEVTF